MNVKTLGQKIDEIHTAVTKLEERVPERLRERLARVESTAHAPPCRPMRAWNRSVLGVGVLAAAFLVLELIKMIQG